MIVKKTGKIGIVAFAFGAPKNILSNLWIAIFAEKWAKRLRTEIYTQRDVSIEIGFGIKAEYIAEEPGSPPSTLRMARGAVLWAENRGFNEILVVAANPHVWRCKRDLEYVIRERKANIKVSICEYNSMTSEYWWYCQDSVQPRTRSRSNWRRREWVLERLPMWAYSFLASRV
ncbi:hypothetical protein COS61_02435 [Candidatus Wolfebacteria bacterium CG03_land_8_20_14_0_80_40_12]|uniref:Uncharacterized protein n=1 Tax=Candidatus Wolfebacteria bacterium CG03_land_8_20_14_0_80_40_12 TaxID=1975069 RepID=A0A2M7B5D1_9BACT|nr:MAG: hypothetical protein COS61_02435 [Candidatus Wolfebacteria bacterium CG03_land_8_20_14_0_80_40_12]